MATLFSLPIPSGHKSPAPIQNNNIYHLYIYIYMWLIYNWERDTSIQHIIVTISKAATIFVRFQVQTQTVSLSLIVHFIYVVVKFVFVMTISWCNCRVMTNSYLDAPASPHIVVAADGLAVSHEAEVHSRTDEITVECKIHATHGKEGALWNCQNRINIPNICTHTHTNTWSIKYLREVIN